MKTPTPAMLLLALALTGCRDDPTGTPPRAATSSLMASRHEADDPPRFSDWSEPVNLAPVNSTCADQTPTLSKDQLALYFTSNRRGGLGQDTPDGCQNTTDLWVSRRVSRHSPWQTPENLGPVVNSSANEGGANLSSDGRLLFFHSTRPGAGQFDIYVSRRKHTRHLSWGTPRLLGPDVNTAAFELAPDYVTIEDDEDADGGGATLYFHGGLDNGNRSDIYAAPVTRHGETRGPAVLISELSYPNVPDGFPSVRQDGREIFFSSGRPGGVSQFDLWTSTRPSVHDPWSAPVNLGTPVNSEFGEFQPDLSFDGRTLLFMVGPARGGLGGFDIWMSTRTLNGEVEGDDADGGDRDDETAPRFSAWSTPVNLGPVVNTSFIEQGPSISRNGLSLYFQCGNCPTNIGGADIYVSQRASTHDPWGPPQRLGPAINTTSNEQAPRLSRDGRRLFFNSDRPEGFGGHDLYVARRQNKHDDFAWEPPVNLGAGVNTTQDDVQGDPFEDDETDTNILYFSSGLGGTDIYVSVLLADGTYGPRALVTELNSAANDRQPSIRRDGLEMFLGSDRLGTLGAIDLWVATRARTSDPWSAPVNLGPVVNTTQVDGRPALSSDGTTLYFQSTRPGAVGCTSPTGPCVFDLWVTTRSRLDEGERGDADDGHDQNRGRHER